MIKHIKLLDREIEYDLQVERVKNINLRIKPDRTIIVSANPRVQISRIEKFILEKQEFILKALEKYAKMQKHLPKPKQYIDGETVKLFGQNFTLRAYLAKKNYVEIDESFINLYLKDINDISLKKKVLEKWLLKQVEETVTSICKKVYMFCTLICLSSI